MLTKREKYDYRDTDRRELKLISVGHAIWRLYLREKRFSGSAHVRETVLLEACKKVWAIKKQLRDELKRERAAEFEVKKHQFARFRKLTQAQRLMHGKPPSSFAPGLAEDGDRVGAIRERSKNPCGWAAVSH